MPEIRDFLRIITGWGELGKVICRLAQQFSGRCRKKFRAKMAQPPLEKIGPYAYVCDSFRRCTPILTIFSLLQQEICD